MAFETVALEKPSYERKLIDKFRSNSLDMQKIFSLNDATEIIIIVLGDTSSDFMVVREVQIEFL